MAGLGHLDPIEDPHLPLVLVGFEGTDELPDMIQLDIPGGHVTPPMAEHYPDWWCHPGLDRSLWHPPMVPQTWRPPQVIPKVGHPPLKWTEWHPPLEWPHKTPDIVLINEPLAHCKIYA